MPRIPMRSLGARGELDTILLVRAALLALALPSIGGAQAERDLRSPWRAFPTGAFPDYSAIAVETADLDGDGDLDAVVGHDYYGGPGIAVLRGDGEGGFGAPEPYATPYLMSVGDVALADVDRDGRPDVLATIPDLWGSTSELAYWRNLGDGTLAARVTFTTGMGPRGLAVGDFTGDGFPDVVTANGEEFGGSTVSLLEHSGVTGPAAGFLPAVHTVAAPWVELVEAADLDGDGDLDLVAGAASAQGNAVLLNDGTGTFGAPTLYPSAPGYTYPDAALALGDFDRDGDVDLVASNAHNGVPNYGIVTLRRNAGNGTFGPPTVFRLPDWSWLPKRLVAGDVNGDGWLDVVATTPSGRSMDGCQLLLNDGIGAGFLPGRFLEAAKSTWDAEIVDVEGDGDLDLVTCAYDSSVVTVHVNPGTGDFLELERNLVGVLTSGMDHGDIDGDGDVDVVTCDDSIRIVKGNGDGTFQPAVRFVLPLNPGSVKLRDMDGDADLDLLIGDDPSSPPYDFAVALNRGDGSYDPAVITPVGASQAGDLDGIDLDGDGKRDVVLADPGPASANYVFRNLGNGTSFAFVRSLAHGSSQIEGADLDHDGNQDVIGNTAFGLTIWPGNGDLSFDPFHSEGFAAAPFELTDLDADGNHDLVVIFPQPSFGTMTVGTVLGYGDGDFAFPREYVGTSGREGAYRIAKEVHAADVTGDGILDLVLTSNAPCDVSIYPGLGDGRLEAPTRHGVGYQAGFTAAADFTGDGAIDLAATISLPPGGFQDAIVLLESVAGQEGGLLLTSTPFRRGQVAELRVANALPLERVYWLYTFQGVGAGPCYPYLGGLCVDLIAPKLAGQSFADGAGDAVLPVAIPPSAPLIGVHLQALVRRGAGGIDSVASNALSTPILP